MGWIGRIAGTCAAIASVALAGAAPAGASFPGLNGKIAFESRRTGQVDIFIANADGSDPVNLTADLDANAFLPSFSPDGRTIVFVAQGMLATMNADGSNRVVSSISAETIGNPIFTPDGQRIIFERDPAGTNAQRLFIIAADLSGTPQQLDTGGTASSQELYPTLSPDGNQLAWTSNRVPIGVYLGAGNGSGGTQFRPGNISQQVSPEFFPDGSRLVWIERIGGTGFGSAGLLVAPLDPIPAEATLIPSDGVTTSDHVTVSPDSTRVAYSSFGQGGDQDVLTSKLDGSQLTNVSEGATSNLVFDRSPAWAVAVDTPRTVTAAYKKRKKRFSGTLTSSGDAGCVPGAPILIERKKKGGKLKQVATAAADAAGAYSIKLKRPKAGKYLVSSPADPREGVANCLAAPAVKVKVKGKKRRR